MHFEQLNKANFVEKNNPKPSGIYIGERTSHGLQASLDHERGIQDAGSSSPGVAPICIWNDLLVAEHPMGSQRWL